MQEPSMPRGLLEQKSIVDEKLAQLMSKQAADQLMSKIESNLDQWGSASEEDRKSIIARLLEQAQQSVIAHLPEDVQQQVDTDTIHEMIHSDESKSIIREGFESGIKAKRNERLIDKISSGLVIAAGTIIVVGITVGIVSSLANKDVGTEMFDASTDYDYDVFQSRTSYNLSVNSSQEYQGADSSNMFNTVQVYVARFLHYCVSFVSKNKFKESLPQSLQERLNKVTLGIKLKPEVAKVDKPVHTGPEVKGMVANMGHAIEKKAVGLSADEQKKLSEELSRLEVDTKAIVESIVGSQNPSMLARKAVGVFASIDNQDTSVSKEDIAQKYVENFVAVCLDKSKLDTCMDLAKHLDNCPKEAQVLAARAIATVANDEIQKSAGSKEAKQKQVEEVRKAILSNLGISDAGESQVNKLMQEKVREALLEIIPPSNQPGKISGRF